jgi:polyhydroxyalkanoate synthesis regulator phasin
MQEMKEEFNKDKKLLKKHQIEILEMKSSINLQQQKTFKSLSSRLDQIEDRMSGLENKVDELEYEDEDK